MQQAAGQDFTSLFLSVSIALVLICFVAFAVLKWVLPRMVRAPFARKDGLIHIVARYALAPRQAIYLLKVGKKYVLLGSSDKGLSLLTPLDEGDLPEAWR